MFGKEFIHHLDILNDSFGEMNEKYQKKLTKKNNHFLENIKKLYIFLFGIPEIGFQIRSLYFKQLIHSPLITTQPKKILDAGSGIGAYTFYLSQLFPKAFITAGDVDKKKLKSARIIGKSLALKNIEFIYFDLRNVDKKQKYDLIVSIDVLEHIENYKNSLKNLYMLLNKKGYLYIHVPQPNQKRIFSSMASWHHDDHVYEGLTKRAIETELKKLGCKIIKTKETFGFFGKLAWEINHMLLEKSFVLTGITFPFLYLLAVIDSRTKNKDGLGVAILVQKK